MKVKILIATILFISFGGQAEESTKTTADSLRNNEQVRVVRKGMAISGGCLFGISYGLALIVTPILASSEHAMDQRVSEVLWIPFAGPIVADVVDGIEEPAFTFVCVSWSLAETIGAILLIRGLVGDKHKKQWEDGRFKIYPKLAQGRYLGIEISLAFP